MDESICTVSDDPQVPCVVMEWQGCATSSQFRGANERVLEAVRRHRAAKMLAEVRDFTLIHATEQEWLVRDWPLAQDRLIRRARRPAPVPPPSARRR